MNRVIKVLSALITVGIMSGCVGIQDPEGWRSGQKMNF